MLHNTHIYFASKLYRSDDPILLIGSFLPDIAVTKVIGWEDGLHGEKAVNKFSSFIKKKYPKYIDLARGVHCHNVLDDFTHSNYLGGTGFAYQNNEKLSKKVGKIYDLSKERAEGVAHNYIESGVDILLLSEYGEVSDKFTQSVELINQGELSKVLSSYFKLGKDKFLDALPPLFRLFTKYDLPGIDNWIVSWGELDTFLGLKDIGGQRRKEILEASVDVVKDTYKIFLEYSLKHASKL